ncbi:MAG: transglutaminase domain-containing protein [Candidatus Kapaibacterium sp.]
MFVAALAGVATVWAEASVARRPAPGDSTRMEDIDSLTLSVLESQNDMLDPHSYFYPFSLRPNDSLAIRLRALLPDSVSVRASDEEEFFPALLGWVHERWQHDSFNSIAAQASSLEILARAAGGERFTCVEYAKVMTDMLASFGYAARMTGLSRRNISNPRLGARHVVTEVWSCRHRKWMMLDAQFGSLAERAGIPLHVAELQTSIRSMDSTVRLHIIGSDRPVTMHLQDSSAYTALLRSLDSFVDIPYINDDKVGLLMLVPSDRNEPLLFQGHVISNTRYTRKMGDLYASVGDVHMDLAFVTRDAGMKNVLLDPVCEVTTSTAYPFTRHLEVSIDGGAWKRANGHRTTWRLHRGENAIAVRTVCVSGCTTKPASMVVYYGLRKDAREARRRRSAVAPGVTPPSTGTDR